MNPSTFPAVPMGSAGIRFTHTLLHDETQVEAMLSRLSHHLTDLIGVQTEIVIDLTESSEEMAGEFDLGRRTG